MTTYVSIFIALFAFSLIVTAHEAGHLVAAKKNGIFVIEFAIGMGPKLISKQIGETVYSIRLLPIGGYCKMLGEDQDCDDPRAFGNKSPFARFVVLVSGALMNFIFGIVLLIVFISIRGYSTTTVENTPPEQPAYKAGIRPGDKIISVNGRKAGVFEDIQFEMAFSDGNEVRVITNRGEESLTYDIIPAKLTFEDDGKQAARYVIGISPVSYSGFFGREIQGLEKAGIGGCITNAFKQFGFYVRTTYDAIYMLFTGKVGLSELSGIIGIGGAFVESIESPINETNEQGVKAPLNLRLEAAVLNVLLITILITINLGIMNLLPFPALDGGRAVFVIIEAIRRKPFDPNKEGVIHFIGIVILMLLMVFVTYNDILRVFG